MKSANHQLGKTLSEFIKSIRSPHCGLIEFVTQLSLLFFAVMTGNRYFHFLGGSSAPSHVILVSSIVKTEFS